MRYPAPPSTATTKKLMTALSEYSLHFSSVVLFCCFFLRYCSSRSCCKRIKTLVNLCLIFSEKFSHKRILANLIPVIPLTEFNDTTTSAIKGNVADQLVPLIEFKHLTLTMIPKLAKKPKILDGVP